MLWPTSLHPATFLRRDNRFRAQVLLDGQQTAAHVPNSGRLTELLVAGTPVWVRKAAAASHRRTACDLVLVEYAHTLVSVDARLPNRLLGEALATDRLSPLRGYPIVKPEFPLGRSRLDYLLEGDRGRCWVETKSVTLVENGTALFPDAPTLRGVRHLEELAQQRVLGDRAAVFFIIQRADAESFSPHPTAHPGFAAALRQASTCSVEVYAWRCRISLQEIVLDSSVPVFLDGEQHHVA